MSSETTTSPQDATGGPSPSVPLPGGETATREHLVAYLNGLAQKLAEWQHLVFNASHNSPNRVGLANTANEIQLAAYEIHMLVGCSHTEAKIGARIPLSADEQQKLDDQVEAERRAESVKNFRTGLHGQPAGTSYQFPEGRRSERE